MKLELKPNHVHVSADSMFYDVYRDGDYDHGWVHHDLRTDKFRFVMTALSVTHFPAEDTLEAAKKWVVAYYAAKVMS